VSQTRVDESTSFEMIDRIIQESLCHVLKADGGDITLVDFSDGVVKTALEKTRVPVAFSNFLVTFKVRTGCSCGRCNSTLETQKTAAATRLSPKSQNTED